MLVVLGRALAEDENVLQFKTHRIRREETQESWERQLVSIGRNTGKVAMPENI